MARITIVFPDFPRQSASHLPHGALEGTIATSEHLFKRNAEYVEEEGDGRGPAALCMESSLFIQI